MGRQKQSRHELVQLARAACRPDIAAEIESLDGDPQVVEVDRYSAPTAVLGWRTHTNQDAAIQRWDLPRRPLWLVTVGMGGLSDGEGWGYEELTLTEYDVSDERIAAAVREVLEWETPFESEWAAMNTQYRLRPDYADRLSERRDTLANGMHRWVDAVTALRTLDPRPALPPTKGGREL